MEIVRERYGYKQGRQRKRRWGVLATAILGALLIFSSGGYTYAALQKPLPPLSTTAAAFAPIEGKEVKVAWPKNGLAAIGSLEEGVLATAKNTEEAKPIASMTKIVTALAVMQKAPFSLGDPGKTYTITSEDTASFSSYLAKDGSVVPIKVGQKITQYQAMQGLLLISANNMADSLVRWTFGSMDAYTAYANQMVKNYGLDQTVISDASGFSSQTVSTPSELIILGQKALMQPVIKEIVAQKQATFPGYGTIRNTNQLLATDGVIGIKTGTTDEAGSCLLFAASHTIKKGHNVTIIGVVMDAENTATLLKNSQDLLTSAKKNFGETIVLRAGTEAGIITSKWGQSSRIVTGKDLKVAGWKGKSYNLLTTFNTSADVVSANANVGTVSIDGYTDLKTDIKSETAITEPTRIWRLQNFW